MCNHYFRYFDPLKLWYPVDLQKYLCSCLIRTTADHFIGYGNQMQNAKRNLQQMNAGISINIWDVIKKRKVNIKPCAKVEKCTRFTNVKMYERERKEG